MTKQELDAHTSAAFTALMRLVAKLHPDKPITHCWSCSLSIEQCCGITGMSREDLLPIHEALDAAFSACCASSVLAYGAADAGLLDEVAA